jgi:hypothetical protein
MSGLLAMSSESRNRLWPDSPLSGLSISMPSTPAKASRCSPRLGSSGMRKSLGLLCGTPTASSRDGTTQPPAGCIELVTSCTNQPAGVSRTSAGSPFRTALFTERKR